MSESRFSNRRGSLPGAGDRASVDRAIAELDRLRGLPAGDPETLRLFMHGRPRLVVPPTMTAEQVDELVELARQGAEAEATGATADAGEGEDS